MGEGIPKVMEVGLDCLVDMEYPGRVIIVGRTEIGANVVAYGLSGRSAPSKARRLNSDMVFPTEDETFEEKGVSFVSIEVTDLKQLEEGDPALLVYDAIVLDKDTIVVSNGAQTNLIRATASAYRKLHGQDMPVHQILPVSFAEPFYVRTKDGRLIDLTCYEPDSISTPRISGVVRGDYAMLCVVKKGKDGSAQRNYYELELKKGQGKMIATYDGPNPPKPEPVPAFDGEPRDITFEGRTVIGAVEYNIADAVYDALGEFRVSAACMLFKEGWDKPEIGFKNLHGDGGE